MSDSSLSGLEICSQHGKEGVNAKVNDVFVQKDQHHSLYFIYCEGGVNTKTALFGEVGSCDDYDFCFLTPPQPEPSEHAGYGSFSSAKAQCQPGTH